MATASEELAEFAAGLRLADVPEPVVGKVKKHILDTLGASLVGADMPWVRAALDYGRTFGRPGRSRLIALSGTLDPEDAALVNATTAHACEIDDRHVATGHVGCVVVPSCLAVAEDVSGRGADCLLATIIAYEVSSRVAMAATISAALDRGFHNTGVYNGFGAAAGAGHLIGLDAEQLMHAMGIAGSHASGLAEGSRTGVGRYHGGNAAATGIRSARLAKLGMTGPPTVYEGKSGYLQGYSGHPVPELMTKDLGVEWGLMGNRTKRYPVNGTVFHQIDALESILAEHSIQPSDVKRIRVGVDSNALHVGIGAYEGRVRPRDFVESNFIAAYILGMRVVKRSNDFSTYLAALQDDFADPEILRVGGLIELYLDEEAEAMFPEDWLAKVTLTTHDGRTLEARAVNEPELDMAQVEDKFRELLRDTVPADRVEQIIELVNAMDQLESIDELARLL